MKLQIFFVISVLLLAMGMISGASAVSVETNPPVIELPIFEPHPVVIPVVPTPLPPIFGPPISKS